MNQIFSSPVLEPWNEREKKNHEGLVGQDFTLAVRGKIKLKGKKIKGLDEGLITKIDSMGGMDDFVDANLVSWSAIMVAGQTRSLGGQMLEG